MKSHTRLSFKEFDNEYQQVVNDVYNLWNDDLQNEISIHCQGWAAGAFDFRKYLITSSLRYYYAYCTIQKQGASICDVGGFWGVFPVTLSRLGFDVTMTEALQYYGNGFDPIFDYIRNNHVEIIDYNPFEDYPHFAKKFDLVTVMAILEHYPHSPSRFMDNVKTLVNDHGKLYLEVPNIAYLPKRFLFLFFGQSPLTPIEQIYASKPPFIGHHHEYTIDELRTLANLCGLQVVEEHYYNSWRGDFRSFRNILRRPHEWIIFSLWKKARNCLSVVCERRILGPLESLHL